MSLECTTQNGMHLPLGMGGEQQAQSISWLPNNDSQHLMLTEDQSLLHQRDLECSTDASVPSYSGYFGTGKQAEIDGSGQDGSAMHDLNGNACLRLQLGGQYHYPPYGLNFLLDKNMKPDGKMNMQGPPLDYQVGESARYGVDINTGGIIDIFANFVWEPAVVKINAINAATEVACLILSVDEIVKNPKSESAQGDAAAGAMGRGRGGAVSVAVKGECEGVELLGFQDAKNFLE
ncbi:hypothetical protein IFM89_034279 [Coptis chinensis]|uniref:Uncharacterized protein n=1 Tax=Coptis chinensis TaxID=261450 RepID=A0A835IV62_9MAGN|nr:hypothetical protein IFM89_034279 [Coptis chinensis]